MSSLTLQSQVADIVTAVPQTADVFRKLRIDFCCGGQVPLEQAALKRGLEPNEVLEQVQLVESKFAECEQSRPADLTELELIDYIQKKHHAFLKEELPALVPYVTKLARVHGGSHPELLRVQELFSDLKQELLDHTTDEDEVVFPLITRFMNEPNSETTEALRPHISELEGEHESAGCLLKEIREVTSGFVLPADACGTYRLVYQRLAHLEQDTFDHIHLENNILFRNVCTVM
ncbi:iron-sulfur cluster repair di-iron protein [Shouchella clausii]|uniref:Iron-sulfur cluster repair di-iron protein n=1 Tax=Shouchella clausii TaxID=79880 RepID=A0A268RXH5_SHOCL|nr:iron-sulfur cluster repair di-iron protein [Shouchella clausii]MBU8596222.1 iron-sulfur cluster repair di-iron protein [Shouchella clausii]MCY1103011.1 iron-sulfur cluster repair di-iron protein [Shouchella clausii]PAD09926.1 iron-sulfur cluster repair di-iron protein [Shouchella clausii]PAE84515.1 iron-sulfur cluster repair di-iron protein [Shouchella clausii]PAE99292.1 iron-sulfur cluster repair di-iron protein [Shouchella clausii]